MKVFNISDVETKQLKQRGLVGHAVVVGKKLLSPGESVEIDKSDLAPLQELVDFGVLSFGAPPKGYVPAAKSAPKEEEKKEDSKAAAKSSQKSSKKDG